MASNLAFSCIKLSIWVLWCTVLCNFWLLCV